MKKEQIETVIINYKKAYKKANGYEYGDRIHYYNGWITGFIPKKRISEVLKMTERLNNR